MPLIPDIFDVIFQRLITPERIVLFTGLAMFFPFLTRPVFRAIPAELNVLFLYGTGNKRATQSNSIRAFATFALIFSTGMMLGAQPAGKPADAYFGVTDIHIDPIYKSVN